MAAPPITERHLHHFHRRSPIKEAVRVATTANITISTALNNGDSLDGITLATDDRVLVKDQSTASQNGIYVVAASPARAYDQSTDDPAFGFLVYVRDGTAGGGKLFKNTNLTTPTIGSTSLTFAELTGSGGSGTDLGWFNVMDYGAVGDGTTNDTVAVQDTIDAATAAGGGTVYFPPGIYLISGALQDTGAFNAQLLLPDIDYTTQQSTLIFRGAVRPQGAGTVQGGTPKSTVGYSIIKSSLTGASGTAAMISGGQWASIAGTNNLRPVFTDLVIEGPPNPTFTALNLDDCQDPVLDGVLIYTGETTSITQPTNSNSYAVKLGHNGTSNIQLVTDVLVSGFYTAFLDGDRVYARGVRVGNCVRALEIPFTDHTSDWEIFQAACGIGIVSSGSSGKYVNVDYRAEHVSSPSWQVTSADLSDASNRLYGDFRWSTVESGVGNSHTFTQSGGTNLVVRELGAAVTIAASQYRAWLFSASGGTLTILTATDGTPLTGLMDLE